MKKKVFHKNKDFGISILLQVIEGILSGANFMVIMMVIEFLFEKQRGYEEILKATGALLGIFLLRLVLYRIGYTKGQVGGAYVSKNIRKGLGEKLGKIPLYRFSKSSVGKYVNSMTEDVNKYEQILTHKVGDVIRNSILVIMVMYYMLSLHTVSGVLVLISFLALLPALYISFKLVQYFGVKKNKIVVENVTSITEYMAGIQTLRAYGFSGKANQKVTQAMKNFSDISFNFELAMIPIGVLYNVLQWCIFPGVIYFAGHSYLSGDIRVGEYILLALLPLYICKIYYTLYVSLTEYKNLVISKGKIIDVLKEDEENGKVGEFKPTNYKISFQNVNFAYEENEPVLQNVNMICKENQLSAIVGPSGSGKSTIMNVLSKYYTVNCGTIKIGDISIEDIPPEDVLQHISIVAQEVFLFNDTIMNNIRYANLTATDEEVIIACKKANCHECIASLPEGYETIVGENGNRLSGGERQRISIARAILKESPIILLDEATSSLDIENELAVKKAITRLIQGNKTVIMIAHTLSTIKSAEQIIVLDEGKVCETGKHDELIQKKGKYYTMWTAEQKIENMA